MEQGLYEQLLTLGFRAEIDAEPDTKVEAVDEGDQAHVLARHVEAVLQRALAATSDPHRRLTIVNDLLQVLAASSEAVVDPPQQLLALRRPPAPGVVTYEDVRPATPLTEAALLTNTRGEPNLGSELKAELDTADEVDLLCAFVKWYGLRLLEPELARRRDRGAPFRVITTTYMGATDPDALDVSLASSART